MRLQMLAAGLLCLAVSAVPAGAQSFGKNVVKWQDEEWLYDESEHFAYYIALDLSDPDARAALEETKKSLETAYTELSVMLNCQVKRKIVAVLTRTHSSFEGLNIADGRVVPEGVGAYAQTRGRVMNMSRTHLVALKADFDPELTIAINYHELVHAFTFELWNPAGFREPLFRVPHWTVEAMAEYLAGKLTRYPRDEIRHRAKRLAAVNAMSSESGVPTLTALEWGWVDPYVHGTMFLEFLDATFGEKATIAFLRDFFADSTRRFLPSLEDLAKGSLVGREQFDSANRAFWLRKHGGTALVYQRPMGEYDNVVGRPLLAYPWPYRTTSPRPLPDGTSVAFVTGHRRYELIVGTAPVRPGDVPYAADPDHKRRAREQRNRKQPLQVASPFTPPSEYDYLVAQEQNTWPVFRGADLDVWQDPVWAAKARAAGLELESAVRVRDVLRSKRPGKEASRTTKRSHEHELYMAGRAIKAARRELAELRQERGVSLVAYFARIERDHAIVILDLSTRKVIRTIKIPQDQGFSPAFSPDGATIYYSAAVNIRRDIYAVAADGSTPSRRITTEGRWNTAPAVSPDGRKLAYVAYAGSRQKLFLRDLATGATEQLTDGEADDNAPSWSSDGSALTFATNEGSGIWNVATVDLSTRVVRRWTNLLGGAYTPAFLPGSTDRVVAAVYVEDNQIDRGGFSSLRPNFAPYEFRLKSPLAERVAAVPQTEVRTAEAPAPQTSPVVSELSAPPLKLRLDVGDLFLFGSSRGGFAGSALFRVQDTLQNHEAQLFAAKSRYLTIADFRYVNKVNRWQWTAGGSYTEYPMVFRLANIWGVFPRYPEPYGDFMQFYANSTRFREQAYSVGLRYPVNRWKRWEFGVGIRNRDFTTPRTVTDEDAEFYPEEIYRTNKRLDDFFRASDGTHATAQVAWVYDTARFDPYALGAVTGSAVRAQAEFGYPLGGDRSSFGTFTLSARQYFRIAGRTVFALRADGLWSSRPTGEAMFMGSSQSIRTYPDASISGDRIMSTSAELRIPLADGNIFGVLPLILNGVVFTDWVTHGYSNDAFPRQEDWAIGFGAQLYFGLPLNFEWARTQYDPDRWAFRASVRYRF